MPSRLLVLPAVAAVLAAAACGTSHAGTSGTTGTTTVPHCEKARLKLHAPGRLTIAAAPAGEPWFKDGDPANGEGFDGAVAYAIADRLGFAGNEVVWAKGGNLYAPGEKDFDFGIGQIPLTSGRAEPVTLSIGYYEAARGVVGLDGGGFARATARRQFRNARIGVQASALTAVREQLQPKTAPSVFADQAEALKALESRRADVVVIDLPAVLPRGAKVIGRLPGGGEQFGLLLEQDDRLVACLNQAITELRSAGRLRWLADRWLGPLTRTPVLK